MNKYLLFLISLFVLLNNCYSQTRVIIKLKNNTEVDDIVEFKTNALISTTSENRYIYEYISELTIFKKKDTIRYQIIDAKSFLYSKEPSRGFANILYEKGDLTLYNIAFITDFQRLKRLNPPKKYEPRKEVFVKKKGEKYAYNIGFIDAFGYYKLDERIIMFFRDCSLLIAEFNKNRIGNKQVIEMIDFYDENCSN